MVAIANPRPMIHVHVLKSLTASLILRCLEDLQRWEKFHGGKPPNKTSFVRREAHRAAYHAIRWINGGPSDGRITFTECCDIQAMNQNITRDRILAMIDGNALDAALEPVLLLTPGKKSKAA